MDKKTMRVNEINPYIPDPVESRRAHSGAAVRLAYGFGIIALVLYGAWYFGRAFIFLEGTGIVSAPLHDVSTPYLSQIEHVNVAPGISVSEGDLIARIRSPQLDQEINNLDRLLLEQSQKEADLRIRYEVAKATSQSANDRLAVTNEAYSRLEGSAAAAVSFTYKMDVSRERSQASMLKAQADAEAHEIQDQLDRFDVNRRFIKSKISQLQREFNDGKIIASVDGIIGNRIGHSGEVIKPGDPIAEIYDVSSQSIIWHIPSLIIREPRIGDPVYIHYGRKILAGYICEIKQITELATEANQSILRDKQQMQIILVRLRDPKNELPVNSVVTVRMNYSARLDQLIGKALGSSQ